MRRTVRRVAMIAALAGTLSACGEALTGPGGIATGTYVAAAFSITQAGQAPVNVLADGGSLTIRINADGTTSGALVIPSTLTGGAPFTASMAGTVTVTSLTVKFEQNADTFVRDLNWSRTGQDIRVENQVVAGTSYTITLIRP